MKTGHAARLVAMRRTHGPRILSTRAGALQCRELQALRSRRAFLGRIGFTPRKPDLHPGVEIGSIAGFNQFLQIVSAFPKILGQQDCVQALSFPLPGKTLRAFPSARSSTVSGAIF